MDITSIYAARSLPRPSLGEDIVNIIAKLKISFKPAFRRTAAPRRREADNWRENALSDLVRKVRVKDDVDYAEINAIINKLSKSSFPKLMADLLERLAKNDAMFRLRITTTLFDRAIRQTFFATLMADAYDAIAKAHPDALQDLASQTAMFETLYDTENITIIPSSNDPGYNDAVIAWTKQKEMKRGFAVYVSELYTRGMIPEDTMMGFLNKVIDELKESIRIPKTNENEEHVDALVRFLFAVSTKMPIRALLQKIHTIPKAETPSLSMKNRFKVEDAMKLSK
jgi:hypothetical protein